MRAIGIVAALTAALIAVQGAQGSHGARKPRADLGISLISPADTVGPVATYRLLITNKGPNKATGVGVDFIVPDGMTVVPSRQCSAVGIFGSCKLGSLGFARGKVLPLTLRAPDGAFALVRFSVYGNRPDPDPSSDLIDQVISIERPPALADLSVSIQRTERPYPEAVTPHYAVTITNNGPGDALRTIVRYDLKQGIYFAGGNIGDTLTCGTSGVSDSSWAQVDSLGFLVGLDKPRSFQYCVPRIAAGTSRTFDIGLGAILYWVDKPPWTVNVDSLTPDPSSGNNVAGGDALRPGNPG